MFSAKTIVGLDIGSSSIKAVELKRQKGAEYVLETELVIRKSTAPRAGAEQRRKRG